MTTKKKIKAKQNTKTYTCTTKKPTAEIFFPYGSCFPDGPIPTKRGTEKPKTKVPSAKQPEINNVIHHYSEFGIRVRVMKKSFYGDQGRGEKEK